MSKYNEMDINELHELFECDFTTGVLVRKVSRGNRAPVGSTAGHTDSRGYVSVRINGKAFQVHRVVWAMYYNVWPSKLLDHIDRNKSNNSITNLREASCSENFFNKPPTEEGSSKFRGVHITANNTYAAQISIQGKIHYLGTYRTEDEASKAYEAAAEVAHGTFYEDPKYTYTDNTTVDKRKSTSAISGYKGVQKCGNKYLAIITHNKKVHRLGTFSSAEEASYAYQKAKSELING